MQVEDSVLKCHLSLQREKTEGGRLDCGHYKAKVDVFLELSCFFDDPTEVGNLVSGSSAFSKSSLNIWKLTVQVLFPAWSGRGSRPSRRTSGGGRSHQEIRDEPRGWCHMQNDPDFPVRS